MDFTDRVCTVMSTLRSTSSLRINSGIPRPVTRFSTARKLESSAFGTKARVPRYTEAALAPQNSPHVRTKSSRFRPDRRRNGSRGRLGNIGSTVASNNSPTQPQT